MLAARQTTRVSLDVTFRLTDLDNHPIAGATARMVMGSDPAWQRKDTGHSIVTASDGTATFSTTAALESVLRKLPTNFVDSLLSRLQPADHLRVAAELPYASFTWLYVVDLYRFRSGDPVMLDGFALYSRDARGDFTVKSTKRDDGWEIRDLGSRRLTTAGHDVGDYLLQPDPADPTGRHWTLALAFKRHPPPIVR